MPARIWSGDAIVLTGGTVTTFFGGALWFEVDLPSGRAFTLRVLFRTDGGPPRVEASVQASSCDLLLIDFDGATGKGSAEPVLLEDGAEGRLYLHFRVFRHGQTGDREFSYTFFLAPKAEAPEAAPG
jgi:hypothetical protein